MNPKYQHYLNIAQSKHKENKKFIQTIKKQKPKDLDKIFHQYHIEVFEEIDCLECANCCKSISPAVKDNDIRKLSKYLKTKPSEIVENYMHLDEDQDYVMNTAPCPFLMNDNYCSVYEGRPLACKEYPHTDSPKMLKLLDLTLKNSFVCPAVALILEKMK